MVKANSLFFVFIYIIICFQKISAQAPPRPRNFYPNILQDTRNEPTPDGTFGYLYKTEDGIVSSARGGPNGVIQGGFSYTDPTGLKVNINYNAGARRAPSAVEPSPRRQSQGIPTSSRYYENEINARPRASPAPTPMYRSEPEYYGESVQDASYEPQYSNPRYITRPQPDYSPEYIQRPVYRPRPAYRPENVYQQRRSQPIDNEIYDDYRYRG